MVKLSYQNKSFTLIELIIYILIVSILGVLTATIFYSIIFYSNIYLGKASLRNESFRILNKLYFNSIFATSAETTINSIKFNFYPSGYEKLYTTNSKIYLENEVTTTLFSSGKIKIDEFMVTTSSNFYNIFIKMSSPYSDNSLNLTTTLYLWSF